MLVLAFVGLLWSTLRDGTEYFKYVDEVLPQRQVWEGKPLQLKGYVVPGSILRKRDSLEYRFKVQNNPARAESSPAASSRRPTPASFPTRSRTRRKSCCRDSSTSSGFQVKPNGVVAKCPSKYEAAAGS